MADSSSLSGAACRPLSEIDAALIRYEELWSSGTYYGLEGDPVASFSPDDRTIRITQNFDGCRLALVPDRIRPDGRRTPLARRGFVLVDDRGERLGRIAPNSTLVSNRWKLRVETDLYRSELRARTTRSKWDEEFDERRLHFDLRSAAGRASFSVGSHSRGVKVEVFDLHHEALRLLVLVAPLCLPLAGLTGIVASSSG